MLSRPRLSTALGSRRKELLTREDPFDRRVRIKRERGTPQNEIDLVYAEQEEEKRVAGRYLVNCMAVGETFVEVIEFLSDACEGDADADSDLDSDSNASTLDLEHAELDATVSPTTGSMPTRLPTVTVDLTTDIEPQDGLLDEYESIYVDLAQSSSSDDYESSDDDSDDSDVSDRDGSKIALNEKDSDEETPRALVQRRRRQLQQVAHTSLVDKRMIMIKVRKDIELLEEGKPWRFVYRCLKLPFVATPRTDSCGFTFERWDDFWAVHGRAVWERMFWKPLYDGSPESNQRKYRQEKAVRAFTELAVELKTRFGSDIVDEVKNGAQPHPGWWYRPRRPFNLLRLRRQQLQVYQLHLSRCRERWPCGRRYVRQNMDAMWCFDSSVEAAEPDGEP